MYWSVTNPLLQSNGCIVVHFRDYLRIETISPQNRDDFLGDSRFLLRYVERAHRCSGSLPSMLCTICCRFLLRILSWRPASCSLPEISISTWKTLRYMKQLAFLIASLAVWVKPTLPCYPTHTLCLSVCLCLSLPLYISVYVSVSLCPSISLSAEHVLRKIHHCTFAENFWTTFSKILMTFF